ncbi:hypothetical protein [Leuconostoc inhae]|uniref:hypothetical protein n=1 Tax=Leuconostoc inhae TaxID=178001 RepID=UPI001C7DA6FC|nr:hypothetical protein [Leuconostoc inhae]
MKYKIISLLIAIISLSITIALIITSIVTGNHLYAKIGSSFIGIVMCLAGVIEIKKDGKIRWSNVAPYLPGVWFLLNPWVQYL